MRASIAIICCAFALSSPPANESPASAQQPRAGAKSAAIGAEATPQEEARRLLLRQDNGAAERLLLASLKADPPRSPASRADCSRLALLGEVYLRSGSFESARVWLQRALDGLDRASDGSLTMLAEQASTAVLLAKTLSQLQRGDQAVKILAAMDARFAQARATDPVARLDLLSQWAAIERASGQAGAAARRLAEANRLASQLQSHQQLGMVSVEDYARALGSFADCQIQAADWKAAGATLEKLVRLRAGRREILEELSARKRLAEACRQRADSAGELESLRQAIQSLERDGAANRDEAAGAKARRRYDRAELHRLMAAALLRAKRRDEALRLLCDAQDGFAAALALQRQTPGLAASSVSEGAVLERLAGVSGQLLELESADSERLPQAIVAHANLLAFYRGALLTDDPRIARLMVAVGGLTLKSGDGPRAESLLKDVLPYWRRRVPVDHFHLAQTLHLLAEAELLSASAESAQAIEQHLAESRQLCLTNFPREPLRWRTQLAMGRLYLATGRYRQALAQFQDLAAPAERDGQPDDVCSAALMQLGLLNTQLLRFDEAYRFCRQGLDLRRRSLGSEHPELLPFVLALGAIEVARRDAAALEKLVERAVLLGAGDARDSANRAEFVHQRAMVHYLRNEAHDDLAQRRAARDCWEQLRDKESGLPPMLLARCLHYLARLDYLDWSGEQRDWNRRFLTDTSRFSGRVARLTEELKAHEQERRQFFADLAVYEQPAPNGPSTSDREPIYRALLARRAVLEQKRLALRASHAAVMEQEKRLAQLQSGVKKPWLEKLSHGTALEDQAIGKLVAQDSYPSLRFAALCNAAQLLEAQAQCADDGERYLHDALDRLQAAVGLIEKPRANTFGDEFTRAEFFAQYRAAFDLLVDFHVDAHGRTGDDEQLVLALVASERCRGRALFDQLRMAYLGEPNVASAEVNLPAPDALAVLVRRWRTSPEPLLYYYVGASRSYQFVLGGSEKRLQVIRLRAPSSAAPLAGASDDASASVIDQHVHRIHTVMSHPESAASLAFNQALRERIAMSSAILLPPETSEYLRQENARGAGYVCVVPHGAISQLPLEALLVNKGSDAHQAEAIYLADVAPPLAYAPSLALLDHLSRATPAPAQRMAVLTLGNPAYAVQPRPPLEAASAESPNVANIAAAEKHPSGTTTSEISLPPLPDSQQECDRIEALFGRSQVVKLTGGDATEGRLRQALRTHPFSLVHLAAHGILRDDDLSPWLALALPAAGAGRADDNGQLELREIYDLSLDGCDLTVLSACNTNLDARQSARLRQLPLNAAEGAVGPVMPSSAALDTMFSVSNAFLASGSRRVVATQWTVADDSTAQQIAAFFEKLAVKTAAGQPIHYARLLAETRRELRRDNPQWDTPFHWAPFVLIGPDGAPPAAQ